MIHVVTGLISFAAIFAGALIGLFARKRLPSHHLGSETQSAITVSVAVLGTLSALVVGLMITAANSSFSARSDEVRELSLQLIRMDRNLWRYGPESGRICASGHSRSFNSFSRKKANGPLAPKPQSFSSSTC